MITCPDDKDWLAEQIAEFDTLRPDLVSVDFSNTQFELIDSDSKSAVVELRGSISIHKGGTTSTRHWDAIAENNGYDSFTMGLLVIDGSWMICG